MKRVVVREGLALRAEGLDLGQRAHSGCALVLVVVFVLVKESAWPTEPGAMSLVALCDINYDVATPYDNLIMDHLPIVEGDILTTHFAPFFLSYFFSLVFSFSSRLPKKFLLVLNNFKMLDLTKLCVRLIFVGVIPARLTQIQNLS